VDAVDRSPRPERPIFLWKHLESIPSSAFQPSPAIGEGDQPELPAPAAKINNMQRKEIPIGCDLLTMFIDVQQNLLFYVIAAWEADFTGYVIDYGSYPDQQRPYFTLRDARLTLSHAAPNTGVEGAIYAGLETVTGQHLSREWLRDDGAAMRIERCLVDANWGSSTDLVYQFCRQSLHAAVLLAAHGRFVGASSMPYSDYKRRLGDRVGLNWRIPNVRGNAPSVRHVLFDANYWKSFIPNKEPLHPLRAVVPLRSFAYARGHGLRSRIAKSVPGARGSSGISPGKVGDVIGRLGFHARLIQEPRSRNQSMNRSNRSWGHGQRHAGGGMSPLSTL
jgi:hypothetical protein